MKHLFTLRILFLCLFASLGMMMNAEVIEHQEGDLTYKLDTETQTAELARCNLAATEVIIPDSVTYDGVTYRVTTLRELCFAWCESLTSITIPSSVTSLGKRCFSDCSSLTSITIPSSVTTLGSGCFKYCSSLTSIDLPTSLTSLKPDCFYGCSSLKSIDIPSLVTSVGNFCFYGCSSLTSITIPSSVNYLGARSFSSLYSLKTVTCEIPAEVAASFLWMAFDNTPIEQATLYVPEAWMYFYTKSHPWRKFGTILPISGTDTESITVSEPTIEAIFNLEGKRLNSMGRGVNILRMSDGTTRKVVNLSER